MRRSTVVIGLTGGIGSGKSEVSRRFAALGINVIDADEEARAVVYKDSDALKQISNHFGNDILLPDGSLNRAQLRDIIFTNPHEKTWLEQLLHPLINTAIRTKLKNTSSPYAILSSPLLLETKQYELVDRILVVDTSEQLQLERASARDSNNTAQIKAIMSAQLSRQERSSRANDIIQNHGAIDELDKQIAKLHQLYSEIAAQSV